MKPLYSIKTIEDFWSKVNKRGPVIRPELGPCWLWTDAPDGNGRGHFTIKETGERVYAHVFALEIKLGRKLRKGKWSLHDCDVPLCMRHVHEGTHAENMAEMRLRGRAATGERHGSRTSPASRPLSERQANAKVTYIDAVEIRRRATNGEVKLRLAEEFGLSPSAITRIVKRESYTRPPTNHLSRRQKQALSAGAPLRSLPVSRERHADDPDNRIRRTRHGENHPVAKLNAEAVIQIKLALQRGESQYTIAGKYDVTGGTIHAIAVGRTWKHVKVSEPNIQGKRP